MMLLHEYCYEIDNYLLIQPVGISGDHGVQTEISAAKGHYMFNKTLILQINNILQEINHHRTNIYSHIHLHT